MLEELSSKIGVRQLTKEDKEEPEPTQMTL